MILLQILKLIKVFFSFNNYFIVWSIMTNTIGNFISNNVKGIRSSEKRLKISEYLKNNMHHNGFVFLQE